MVYPAFTIRRNEAKPARDVIICYHPLMVIDVIYTTRETYIPFVHMARHHKGVYMSFNGPRFSSGDGIYFIASGYNLAQPIDAASIYTAAAWYKEALNFTADVNYQPVANDLAGNFS